MTIPDIPNPTEAANVADWAELYVCTRDQSLSKRTLEAEITMASGNTPSEGFLSDVWSELQIRSSMYGDAPYVLSPSGLAPRESQLAGPEYAACLLLSIYGVDQGDTEISSLFEEMSRIAVGKYLGGQAFVIGWGSDQLDATSIRAKVKAVSQKTGEKLSEWPASRFKDRGVDAVVHKRPDRRTGQVVILVQSAAGLNWRTKKAVPLGAWTQYVHWAVDPLIAFAVPSIISNRDVWHEESRDKGILFDRVRILRHIKQCSGEDDILARVAAWACERLNGFD